MNKGWDMKKVVLVGYVFLTMLVLVCCGIVEESEKEKSSAYLKVEDVEMYINTSQEIEFSVITDTGQDITKQYQVEDMHYEVTDPSIVDIRDHELIALKEGKTKVKMTAACNEGPIKGKKGVIMRVIEVEFDVIVMPVK